MFIDKQVIRLLLPSLLWALSCVCVADPVSTVTAFINPSYIQAYKKFTQDRDPLSIQDFHMLGDQSNRFLVEMVLLQQFLKLGGYKTQLRFRPLLGPFYTYMANFSDGKIDLSAECLPLEALKPYLASIYISEPMIAYGDYQVALYTAKDNARAQAATSETLKKLSAIGNPGWASDWQALESLNLKRLVSSQSWPNMLKMVARQRVDFTPAPFLGPELVYQQAGQQLVAIRGLKLTIYDSCHYVVARGHPDSEIIRDSINRGIAVFRRAGRIKKAYAQSGFIYPPAEHWTLVNPIKQ